MQLILHEYSILHRLCFNWNFHDTYIYKKDIPLTWFSLEIFNAEVLFREDCTSDEFIDVIVGNRVYMPCLYVSISLPLSDYLVTLPLRECVWKITPENGLPEFASPEHFLGVQQSGPDFYRRSRPSRPSAQQCGDQLWHETESRLPPGAAVGIPGSDLSLHQEERRWFFFTCSQIESFLPLHKNSSNYIIQMCEKWHAVI